MVLTNEIEKKRLELEKLINDNLKLRIKELNLIESGNLYNNIKCVITIDTNGFNIDILSPDYYAYLDNEYNITNYVLNIQKIENKMLDLSSEITMYKILK